MVFKKLPLGRKQNMAFFEGLWLIQPRSLIDVIGDFRDFPDWERNIAKKKFQFVLKLISRSV